MNKSRKEREKKSVYSKEISFYFMLYHSLQMNYKFLGEKQRSNNECYYEK